MLYCRKKKQEIKDGIVIVSISNLFHILDIARTKENDDSPLHKTNTRSVFFTEPALKEKENNLLKNNTNKEIETESKIKENKDEEYREIKGSIYEREYKSKKENNNIEKEVKFKEIKENTKSISKDSYKRNKINKKKKKNSCCDYFFNLVICCLLLLVFNNCYLWIFHYMFSEQKNKAYCFNNNIKEFGICIQAEYCPSYGNHDFIYLNDDSISSTNKKDEIQNINSKYLNFYVHESSIFSSLNRKFLKTESTLSRYSITIISIKNEKYLFNNTFRVGCQTYFIEILVMLVIAIFTGNGLFGLLADIWGRKKILVLCVFIEIVGGYILFISTFFIQNYKKNDIFDNNDFISEFISNINVVGDFVDNYKLNFADIKQEVYQTLFIKERFEKYKIFVFFGIFLIFLANSSVKTITLSYLLENALTEETMSLYYLFYIFSTPLSILLSSFLVIYINSFHIPIIIISGLQLIIIILIMIYLFESQRFNFEYSFYSRITEFTEYILGKDELRINYKVKEEDLKNNGDMSVILEKENMNFFGIYYSLDDSRIQSELNNEKINENTSYMSSIKYPKNYFYKYLYYNKIIQKPSSKNLIERFNVFRNPFYFIKLMQKDKQLKKKYYVIFSFIISLSLVINLTLQRITANYLLQREKLITKSVFKTNFFVYIIMSCIILFPFIHYLVKCFGIYIILFPSLLLITISTAFFELICFLNSDSEITDLNKFHDGENDKLVSSLNKYLLPFIFIISFCFVGLDYVLYFFIIKLTKTIYRCSFLGNCQIIYDICFIISFGLEKFISGGYYYACLFSIISMVNSMFINSSEDSLNISEMREIKFDESKNSEK